MSLPGQIQSVRKLIETLPEREKWRVLEAVRRYATEVPSDYARFKVSGDARCTWYPDQWQYLYVRTLNDGRAMVVDYRQSVAWLYRGELKVERDLLGDKAITLRDELRFGLPIFSRTGVDAQSF